MCALEQSTSAMCHVVEVATLGESSTGTNSDSTICLDFSTSRFLSLDNAQSTLLK